MANEDILDRLADLITIENDVESGVLSFSTIRPFAHLESQLLAAYLNLIKAEFGFFKEQLTREAVNLKDYCLVLQPNSLVIRIPAIGHFDRFIAQLDSKKLLNLEGRTKPGACSTEATGTAHYTPLSTHPTLRPDGALQLDDDF